MEKFEAKHFAVCIIQSLRTKDRKTGSELAETLLKYKKFQEDVLNVYCVDVSNKNELWAELKKIERKVIDEKWFVILHLEAHGYEKGIELSSGEVAYWSELMDRTRPINIALKNYFLIILAMCKGAWLMSQLDIALRAPFKAIIGTFKDVGYINLLNALSEFYDDLFFDLDFERSIDKMNTAFKTEIYYIIRVSGLFDGISNTNRDPEFFNNLIEGTARVNYLSDATLQKMSFGHYKNILKDQMESDFKKIQAKKDYFMMKDL